MKKTIRKVLFAALLVLTLSCLFAFSFTASAEVYGGDCGAEGDNVTWEFDSETGVLTFSGEGETDISADANGFYFWEKYCYDIEKVVVEDNIVFRDEYFDFPYVTEIVIGDNVTIFDYAFSQSYSLRKLTIGENAIVGDNAFCSMNSYDWLIETKIGSISKAGDFAFYGCDIVGSFVILDNAEIGTCAFSPDGYYGERHSKTLKKVIIGDNVSLGESALAENYALSTVEVNGRFKYIGKDVFLNTKIYKTAIDSDEVYVVLDGALFGCIGNVRYIDDSYYIVADSLFDYDDLYFAFGKGKWNEISCGDNNENNYIREYNHKHKFEVEEYWDYEKKKTLLRTICVCGIEGSVNDVSIENVKATSTDTSVTLSWDETSWTSCYTVYRYDRAKSKWVTIKDEVYDNKYKITGLQANSTYRFAVRGLMQELHVPKYNECSVKTKIGTPKITADSGPKHITLEWKAVDGADGYRIYKKVNGSWKTLTETTKLTFSEKDLTEGERYSYAVKAYSLNGKSKVYAPKYSSVSITVKNPTIKVSATRSMKSVELNWKKISVASGYRVYQLSNGKWKSLKTTSLTSYTVNNLKINTKYTFAVRTYFKVNGEVYWSTSYKKISVTTLDYNPCKVTNLRALYLSNTSIKIAWNKSEDAAGYYLYSYNSSTKKYKVLEKTTKLSVTFKDVDLSKTNYYAVRAYKKVDGKTYWSDYSAKLKVIPVPSSAKIVEIFNRGVYDAAYWWGWKPYNSKMFDYNDTFYGRDGEYARIKTSKIKSPEDLKKHLYRYIEKDLVDGMVDGHIIKKNGKLYYMIDQKAGSSGGIDLSGTKFVSKSYNNGNLKCKFKVLYYESIEETYYTDYITVELMLQDGNWVLADDEEWLALMYTADWTGSSYNPYDI